MKRNRLLIMGTALFAVIFAVVFGINQNKATDDMMDTTVAMQSEDSMMEKSDTMASEEEMVKADTNMTDESIPQGDMTSEPMMSNDGKMASDFSLLNLKGEEISLSSFKGEKVYLKFWASWCSICLAGLDDLNQLSGSSEDFKVITIVSPDYNGEQSKEDFITWFESLDYNNIEVLFDENGTITKEFGVRAYPTSAYIGSDGVLVKILPGHVDNQMIIDSFNSIY